MNHKIPKPQAGVSSTPGVTDSKTRVIAVAGTHRPVHIGKRPWSPEKAAARFWARIDRSSGSQACWPWARGNTNDGYGRVWFNGRDSQAHRVAWELTKGPIPAGMVVRHKICDNRLCCNVAHMLLGSQADNVMDAIEKRRHAHGEAGGNARLTAARIELIRRSYRLGFSRYELAGIFEVTHRQVCYIVRGERWKESA